MTDYFTKYSNFCKVLLEFILYSSTQYILIEFYRGTIHKLHFDALFALVNNPFILY